MTEPLTGGGEVKSEPAGLKEGVEAVLLGGFGIEAAKVVGRHLLVELWKATLRRLRAARAGQVADVAANPTVVGDPEQPHRRRRLGCFLRLQVQLLELTVGDFPSEEDDERERVLREALRAPHGGGAVPPAPGLVLPAVAAANVVPPHDGAGGDVAAAAAAAGSGAGVAAAAGGSAGGGNESVSEGSFLLNLIRGGGRKNVASTPRRTLGTLQEEDDGVLAALGGHRGQDRA